MGRRVPLRFDDISLHPVLSFSIFLAGMVAAVAMVSTLCGVRFWRRSSEPSKSSSHEASTGKNVKNIPSFVTSPSQPLPKLKTESAKIAVSPIPARQGSESENTKENLTPTQLKSMHPCKKNLMTKSMSTRNIVATMSMKLPRSFSMARNNNRVDRKEEQCNNKKGKFKPDDSVWMKTIILGEKCKVPDDDEVTIYDGKGNRISTYHPKKPIFLPVSRQNSHIDTNAIHSQDRSSIHQPRSPFSSPVSRQTSQFNPHAIPNKDEEKLLRRTKEKFLDIS